MNNTAQDIKAAYLEIFPLSHISVTKAPLGGNELYIKCYLQRPDEWANKISHNDPLNYMASFNPETGKYEELNHSLTVKATNPYMAYGSAKLRKYSKKTADISDIKNRFIKVREFIKSNLDNAAHDIAEKVGE